LLHKTFNLRPCVRHCRQNCLTCFVLSSLIKILTWLNQPINNSKCFLVFFKKNLGVHFFFEFMHFIYYFRKKKSCDLLLRKKPEKWHVGFHFHFCFFFSNLFFWNFNNLTLFLLVLKIGNETQLKLNFPIVLRLFIIVGCSYQSIENSIKMAHQMLTFVIISTNFQILFWLLYFP
jgi:hypothetical protein